MAKTTKFDSVVKDHMADKIPAWNKRIGKLVHDYGSRKVADVTVEQLYGGRHKAVLWGHTVHLARGFQRRCFTPGLTWRGG